MDILQGVSENWYFLKTWPILFKWSQILTESVETAQNSMFNV